MAKTKIQWTDHSINPFRARDAEGHVGHHCVKISAGCANCYASTLQKRFQMPEYITSHRQGIEVFLDEMKLEEVLRRKKPTKYFWCDMTDMFLDEYPDEWIDKCFAVMALTPHHTHQILTKRPERMAKYFESLSYRNEMVGIEAEYRSGLDRYQWHRDDSGGGDPTWPLPLKNVWLGVSVEDQKTADERIPILLQTPAAVRWISAEPLLGPIDLFRLNFYTNKDHNEASYQDALNGFIYDGPYDAFDVELYQAGNAALDWVVIGGESGHKARHCDIKWIDTLIEQCGPVKVACFVKQLGGSLAKEHNLADRKGGDIEEWMGYYKVRQFPNG